MKGAKHPTPVSTNACGRPDRCAVYLPRVVVRPRNYILVRVPVTKIQTVAGSVHRACRGVSERVAMVLCIGVGAHSTACARKKSS